MNACRWAGARAGTALSWMARVVLVIGPLGGCGGGAEPAPAPVPLVNDACTGECAPGELLLENGCCQPAGLPPDMLCPPGEWPRDDGGCQPAGLPLDMPCPPGEWSRDDGGCQPAGVPPEDCGVGFAPDGNGGCDVILPAEDCQKGQMAIPGETVCHAVAPCGSGDYGDIPVGSATTQFVNQAYAGDDSDGSAAKPWKTIQQGIDAAEPGAIVAVAAGTYSEDAIIQYKPVVLWGRCPALVEVAGTGAELAAVQILDAYAGASEIRALAISGLDGGVMVAGASEVVVDRVWIHDTADRGLDIEDPYGPTSVTVTSSLIEAAHEFAVFVSGSAADLSGVVVRDVQLNATGGSGIGIFARYDPQTGARSSLQLTASVVEQTRNIGVAVLGSDAVLSGVVVRDVQPGAAGNFGVGIDVQNDGQAPARANVEIIASVVERAHTAGVSILGSDAVLSGVVVRDIQPDQAGNLGLGIVVQGDHETNELANVQVTTSVVERTSATGVFVNGSDAELLGVVVRDVQPAESKKITWGVAVQGDDETNARGHLQITASVIERTDSGGVFVLGSDAALSGIVVRDMPPDEAGEIAWGIGVQDNLQTTERGNLQVTASLVERGYLGGVSVVGSDADLSGLVVRDTQPDQAGSAGWGIGIQNNPQTTNRANVTLTASLVEGNHSTGVFVRGAEAELSGLVVRDTQPDGSTRSGWGIDVRSDPETNERARVTLGASLVERNTELGVFISGSDVEVVTTVVRDTQPNGAGNYGRGIQIQHGVDRSNVQVMASVVEQNREVGVLVFNSSTTIKGSIVRDTSARGDGKFGDGVVVMSSGLPAELTLTGSSIGSNARAGLVSFGAAVRLDWTTFDCNGLDIDGEVYQDRPFELLDNHDNLCGCSAVADTCNPSSAGLSPPPPQMQLD